MITAIVVCTHRMAETTRFILHHGGIRYTDELIWGAEFAGRRSAAHFPFDKVGGTSVSL